MISFEYLLLIFISRVCFFVPLAQNDNTNVTHELASVVVHKKQSRNVLTSMRRERAIFTRLKASQEQCQHALVGKYNKDQGPSGMTKGVITVSKV